MATASGVALALVLAACGDDDSSSEATDPAPAPTTAPADGGDTTVPGTGEPTESSAPAQNGVPYGATMEEYQAALADMEPVTFVAQTSGAQGSVSSLRFENYFAAVEEWSGGKITFEVNFANAIASPLDMDKAIPDGRVDIGAGAVVYSPENYPANNTLIDLTFVGDQSPLVGTLSQVAWLAESALQTPELVEEVESKGLYPLVPILTGGPTSLLCKEPLSTVDDFQGKISTATGRSHVPQLGALDVEPVSIPFTEFYEAVQRGVVDCVLTSLIPAVLSGLPEVAPHLVTSDVGWAGGVNALWINKDKFESLPLEAQQLMHDRLDVYYSSAIEQNLISIQTAAQAALDGGSILELSDEAQAALSEANEGLLDSARSGSTVSDSGAFVDGVLESADRWRDIAVDDFGYDTSITFEQFITWLDENEVDLDGFVQRLFEESLNSRRPG